MRKTQARRRVRCWLWIGGLFLLVLGLAAWKLWSGRHLAPWHTLDSVVQTEAAPLTNQSVQLLGWNLAILGRDHEVRELDFFPEFEQAPLEEPAQALPLNVVPWRRGIQRIAEEQRLVMIMESHYVSKHREMIGATLPIFREAGFTHLAVEAIGESESSLAARGFPSRATGFYTSDPQFGNSLRRALHLGYHVFGYDFRPFSHETRESFAATEIAKRFTRSPQARILVHAGLAHVLKHETDLGQRWLAALLWEETGIEPFCIWQWSALRDNQAYRVVAEQLLALGDLDEPVLLMPPPASSPSLPDVPRVDAILVHPPDLSRAPDQRTPLFRQPMKEIVGRWEGSHWPIVIAAYRRGEPQTAVPLDQVLLRAPEAAFNLWIPQEMEFELAAFDRNGPLSVRTSQSEGQISVTTVSTAQE